MNYSKEEISEAYESLIWTQGLIDFALLSGFNIREATSSDMEGSLIAMFHIMKKNLAIVERVLDDLDIEARNERIST